MPTTDQHGLSMSQDAAKRAAEEIVAKWHEPRWATPTKELRVRDIAAALAQAKAEERERIEYALRMTEGCSADTVRSHVREALRTPDGSPGEGER